jgi:hypothetical protein
MSIFFTSAIRKSRNDFDAMLMAFCAACSHDTGLLPTSSTIL